MFAKDEMNRVGNVAGNSPHPTCTSLLACWPVPSTAPHNPKAVPTMKVVKPKYNNTIIPTSKQSSIPISTAKVTPDRVKQLKRDLTNSYDGNLLFHNVWKGNISTTQQQELHKKSHIWDDV